MTIYVYSMSTLDVSCVYVCFCMPTYIFVFKSKDLCYAYVEVS